MGSLLYVSVWFGQGSSLGVPHNSCGMLFILTRFEAVMLWEVPRSPFEIHIFLEIG